MAASKLDVVMSLRGARKFQSDASKSAGSIDKIGNAGKRADKNLNKAGKRSEKLNRNMKRLGTAAKVGGAALGGMAVIAGKNAVKSTQDLTKTVIGLQRATKMDTQEAVRWATQAKVRGIDAKALNMAMGTLSKNLTLAGEGGKSQQEAFDRLGISQKQVKATGGDLSKLLPVMSDRFKKMGPSAGRTASMMALMGRGWQTITPLMSDGSAAMNEQLKLADKYGVKLGDKPIKSQKDLLAVQREMKIAQLGWQVQFSTQIAPKLVKAFGFINKSSQKLKGVFDFAEKHSTVTKVAVGLLAASVATKKLGSALSPVTKGLGLLGKTKAGESLKAKLGQAASGLWGRMRPGVRTAGAKSKTAMASAGRASGTSFAASSSSTAAAGMAGQGAAGAAAGGGIAGATKRRHGRFRTIGRRAGKFLGLGIAAGVVLAAPEIVKAIEEALGIKPGKGKFGQYSGKKGWGELGKDLVDSPREIFNWSRGGRQHGGPIRAGRSALVGEGGPEIATGRPGGAFITPLRKMASPEPRSLSFDGERTTIVPVQIDGREVARVTAKHAANAKARR